MIVLIGVVQQDHSLQQNVSTKALAKRRGYSTLTWVFRPLNARFRKQDIPDLVPLFHPVSFLVLLSTLLVENCPLELVDSLLVGGIFSFAGHVHLPVVRQLG